MDDDGAPEAFGQCQLRREGPPLALENEGGGLRLRRQMKTVQAAFPQGAGSARPPKLFQGPDRFGPILRH